MLFIKPVAHVLKHLGANEAIIGSETVSLDSCFTSTHQNWLVNNLCVFAVAQYGTNVIAPLGAHCKLLGLPQIVPLLFVNPKTISIFVFVHGKVFRMHYELNPFMVTLGKFSFGIGDRFQHQGVAQLRALQKAVQLGVDITPVWNKSNREHLLVHSEPHETRAEANNAVALLKWKTPFLVDADHINLSNVDRFIPHADFFTIDVASHIGKAPSSDLLSCYYRAMPDAGTKYVIPGLENSLLVTKALLDEMAAKFLSAIHEAASIYRHIASIKGAGNFVTEISMDEVSEAQTPVDMFFILKLLANYGIPAQTIAPKFTGRFNKGVDYIGDVNKFAREFEDDIRVIDYAVQNFGLPENLKLSVHSGSDKFSIYPVVAEIIGRLNKGIHVKTAGTTWLEEVIGLALAGGEALNVAQEIYTRSYERFDELCAPYADVIDIDYAQLPLPNEVLQWESEQFATTLRHIPDHPNYNSGFRQLIHVGYKVASEMGTRYTDLLKKHHEIIGTCVEENIFDRHLKRLFNL